MLRTIRPVLLGLAALFTLLLASAPASAQSDILLQLRSGSPAGDRFRVDSAGGVVAIGQIGYGIIPASGAGFRMMWHPQKVAFRAGQADLGGQFDESNIGYYSWGGGALSIAQGIYSLSFGNANTVVDGAAGGVALGGSNVVHGTPDFANYGTAIGWDNDVYDSYGVALGFSNISSGEGAVAIGYNNTADADFSTALGYRSSTNGFQGAFVIGDASTTDSTVAFATNQFMARFAGGYRLYTNATETAYCGTGGGASPSWACTSSRSIKENYLPVDVESTLSGLRSLALNTWTMIGDTTRTPHMGLFAEDFHDAFGLGDSDYVIGFQDMDGVLVAGVQALTDRTDALRADVAARDGRIESLESRVSELEAQNAALEARLRRIEEALGATE